MSLVEKLERELQEAQARLSAAKAFPDLEEAKDRWGILRLCTDVVYEKAIDFEVRNECDCCSGVIVYALPYIEHEGIRLYSKTPAVSFAKRYFGQKYEMYVANEDWDESVGWLEYNGLLLDKIAAWLDDHNAEMEDDLYDDEEEEVDEIGAIENDPY